MPLFTAILSVFTHFPILRKAAYTIKYSLVAANLSLNASKRSAASQTAHGQAIRQPPAERHQP